VRIVVVHPDRILNPEKAHGPMRAARSMICAENWLILNGVSEENIEVYRKERLHLVTDQKILVARRMD